MNASWFEVDRRGLRDIVARRGMAWLVYELVSNAWDEKSTKVEVSLVPTEGVPSVTITVTDDNPEGFKDLRDAWTLFASSKKKGDAEKRGRFNLGEKLVLAMCSSAVIRTTTGAVLFDNNGRHARPKWKTDTGSTFEGDVHMTRAQLAEVLAGLDKLIPPIPTKVNGKLIDYRTPMIEFETFLPTEIADPETGALRRTTRKTMVRLYTPREGETAMLYEMGIPVVETGDAFHVNVMQKVPLNMERDNVTPAYLRDIRGHVLTYGHYHLTDAEKHAAWVTDAITAPTFNNNGDALDEVIAARFGIDRVAFDPSDPEANNIAVSKGMTVVHGGSLPGPVWDKVKEKGLIKPAGQVTPSPKPFSPDGTPLKFLDIETLPTDVRLGIEVYRWVGKKLLGFEPEVKLTQQWTWPFRAAYGHRTLILNYARLGEKHFRHRPQIYELAIHEYAHERASNHLSEEFHDACCEFGAKLAAFFDEFGGGEAAINSDREIDTKHGAKLSACMRAP